MCSVKTPKPPPPNPNSEKKPVYMRNAYLDGLGINSENAGRDSLRIDLGGSVPRPPVSPPPPNVMPPRIGTPGGRNGGYGAGGFNRIGVGGGGNNFGLGMRLV